MNWTSPDVDPDVMDQIFAATPGCGVGLRMDVLLGVDCDRPDRVTWWLEQGFPTPFVSEGNPERRTFWYRMPDGVEMRPRRLDGFEVRAGRGVQCAIPPTIHNDPATCDRCRAGGPHPYIWLGPPVDEEHLDQMPLAPVEFLETVAAAHEEPAHDGEGWDVVLEGEGRDNFLTAVAGFLRSRGASVAAVRAGIAAWNHTFCEPRLPAGDLDRIARSSGRWDAEGEIIMEDEEFRLIDRKSRYR